MNKQTKEPYIILDDMGEEVEITAREFIDRAIRDGWTIDSEVARAIQELIEISLQSGIEFGRQIERVGQLEYQPSQVIVTKMELKMNKQTEALKMEIRLEVLNEVLERMAGVYPEYHKEIVKDMIKEATDD